jgi:hypothetical protein
VWKLARKTASLIFTRQNFTELMEATFVQKGQQLLSVLDGAKSGQAVDMQGYFFNFTMDSIMRLFFGRESNTIGGVTDSYAQAYDEAHRA